MLATVVDTDALLETVAAALVAGVGTTLVFSIAILGVARVVEATREGRAFEVVAFGVLALAATLATAGMIVVGVIVMTHK